MDIKHTNLKPIHHRKGSVKCGLKIKLNTPKGAPAVGSKLYSKVLQNEGFDDTPTLTKRRGVGTLINRYERSNSTEMVGVIPIDTRLKKTEALNDESKTIGITKSSVVQKPKIIPKPAALTTKPKPQIKTNSLDSKLFNSEGPGNMLLETVCRKDIDKSPFQSVKTGISNLESTKQFNTLGKLIKPLNTLEKFNKAPQAPKPKKLQNDVNNQFSFLDKQLSIPKPTQNIKFSGVQKTGVSKSETYATEAKRNNNLSTKECDDNNLKPSLFNKAPSHPWKTSEGTQSSINNNATDKHSVLPPRKTSADHIFNIQLKPTPNKNSESNNSNISPRLPPRIPRNNVSNTTKTSPKLCHRSQTAENTEVTGNSCAINKSTSGHPKVPSSSEKKPELNTSEEVFECDDGQTPPNIRRLISDSASESEWTDLETDKKSDPVLNYPHKHRPRLHSGEHQKKWSKKSKKWGDRKSVTTEVVQQSSEYEDVQIKATLAMEESETEWETEGEYEFIDSQGYEIVEKPGWGPARMRNFKVSTKNSAPSSGRTSNRSSIGSDKASSRRASYYSDKDIVELVQDIPPHSCSPVVTTQNNSTSVNTDLKTVEGANSKGFNTLPLPPRQRKTDQTLPLPSKSKTTKVKNPLLKEVPLPINTPGLLQTKTSSSSSSSSTPPTSPDKPFLPLKQSSHKPHLLFTTKTDTPTPQIRKKKLQCSPTAEKFCDNPLAGDKLNDKGDVCESPPPLLPRTYTKSTALKQKKKTVPSNIPTITTTIHDDIPDVLPPPVPSHNSRQPTKNKSSTSTRALPEDILSKPVSLDQNNTGTLSTKIPPPKRTSIDANYLKPGMTQKGYIPMDQLSKKGDYINPETDLDSVPSPNLHPNIRPSLHLQMPSNCMLYNMEVPTGPDSSSGKNHDYLKLLMDHDDLSERSSFYDDENDPVYVFSEEPLYQIYHCGAVFRDVFQNDSQTVVDDDSYGAVYQAPETVKGYVEDILKRANSTEMKEGSGSTKSDTPSSLETIVETGAGTRTLWAETPQVKDSGLLESLTNEEKKIQEALFEIITSEASYLRSLDLLVTHFLTAPELNIKKPEKMCLTKREHQVLFSNIRKVRSAGKKFLKDLENLWTKNCILNPSEICKVISEHIPKSFDVYVKYCVNQTYQDRMLRFLSNLQEERKTINTFPEALQRLEKIPSCHGLSMQSFLTLPMQRVTRLPLLVDAVCHRMDPKDPGYEDVTHCLSLLQKLVKQCNEGAKVMDNIEQINEIDRMLEFKHIKKIPIVSQSRSLVKKGCLTHLIHSSSGLFKKKKETLYLFLFNDLLLITKKKGDECYQVHHHAPRINVHADTLTEETVQKHYPHAPAGYKHLFLLVLLEKQTEFIFSCESTSECTRWVEAVNPAQSQNENERIYEAWDCPQVQVIHKYIAEQPDELSLEESDVINVFKKMADGWFEGERIRDGARGWFPSNHIIEIQSQHVRAKNLRQRYRMLQMSHAQIASMLENPKKAWEKIDAS